MKRETEVEISIGHGSHGWVISLKDVRSSAHITRMHLSDEQFGKTIGGMPITVEGVTVHASPHLGKYMEVRTEMVPMPERESFNRYDPERWEAIVLSWAGGSDLEEWEPDIERWNSHRYSAGRYKVTFRRWVSEKPEGWR